MTISVHGTNQSATVSGIFFTGSVTEDLVSPSGHLEAQGQLSALSILTLVRMHLPLKY
ncbi:hypothetical protein P4S64_21065 [Vibrio sp. M60_M31a]